MISRAACTPRICLACRLGIAKQSAVAGYRALPLRDGRQQRAYASDEGRQSKARIEALISGRIAEDNTKKSPRNTRTRRSKERNSQAKRARGEVLPDWGLTSIRALRDQADAPKAKPSAKPIGLGQVSAPILDTKNESRLSSQPELESRSEHPADTIVDAEDTETQSIFRYGPHNPYVERSSGSDTVPIRFPKLSSLENSLEPRKRKPREVWAHTTPGLIEGLEDLEPGPAAENPDNTPPEELSDATSANSLREQQRKVSIEDETEKPSKRIENEPARDKPLPKAFGELLHEEPVSVSSLGKPTAAIVLNNPNQMRHARKPSIEIEEKTLENNMHLDWESIMMSNGTEKAESSEEVFANIDELRPRDTTVLRMKDFQRLCNVLLDGFTSLQLRDYIRFRKVVSGAENQTAEASPWVVKRIPWTPIKSLPSDPQTYKQKYAHRILLQQWKLEIQDYVDDLGRAHIWIRPDLYPLLTQGSNSVLETLRQEYLLEANNERMSTTSSECRINITALKPSTYAIISRLDEIFSRLERRTIRIGGFANTNQEELTELARITNTSIELRRGEPQEIQVSWLSESHSNRDLALDEQHETPADVVFRLLTGRPIRADPATTYTAQSIPESNPAAYFADFHREMKSMAWRDRLSKWSRYVLPAGRRTEHHEANLNLSKLAAFPVAPAWHGDATNVATATFGHILHTHPGTNWRKRRRILCPVIPHPASFSALKSDGDEALVQSTAIILNFSAPFGLDPDPSKKVPLLRLYLPVNADADLSNFTLPANASFNAVIPWHINDAMLPNQSVDVRLTHQRFHPLDISQPQLKAFLEASRFNLLQGVLRTPSRVTFTHPEDLLDPKCLGKVQQKSVDISYLFYGLEIHQTIEIPWRGHTLRYSSIEAGLHGGQRQELTLQAGKQPSAGALFRQDRASFLQSVEDIAAGKVFSWDEGYKAMKERQFEDYSFDLPETALGHDFVVTNIEVDDESSSPAAISAHGAGLLDDSSAADQPEEEDVLDDDIVLTKEEKEAMEKEIDAMLHLGENSDEPPRDPAGNAERDPFAILKQGRHGEPQPARESKPGTRSPTPEDEARAKAQDAILATIEKAIHPQEEKDD